MRDPVTDVGLQCVELPLGVARLVLELHPETDENGNLTTYAHDALGRPTQSNTPDGASTTYQYLDYGNPDSQRHRVTKSGIWTETYLDGAQREYKKKKSSGHEQLFLYSDASTRVSSAAA